MAYRLINVSPHEIPPVRKLLELMREPIPKGKTHILAVSVGSGSVSFSVAVPRGKVTVENSAVDITIKSN